MGAILGGTMRSPFTGVVFAIELTHDLNMIVPLLLAVTISYAFTALALRRSILTEKVARRGYHLSREYAVDPLEILFVREVMRNNIAALPADLRLSELTPLRTTGEHHQLLYPVVDTERRLLGVLTRNRIEELMQDADAPDRPLGDIAERDPVVAYTDEPLRLVVYRMAETGATRMPVLERGETRTLAGIVSLTDLLRARTRTLEEERRRERILRLHLPFRARRGEPAPG
jgi:CBS domain-containing protein